MLVFPHYLTLLSSNLLCLPQLLQHIYSGAEHAHITRQDVPTFGKRPRSTKFNSNYLTQIGTSPVGILDFLAFPAGETLEEVQDLS